MLRAAGYARVVVRPEDRARFTADGDDEMRIALEPGASVFGSVLRRGEALALRLIYAGAKPRLRRMGSSSPSVIRSTESSQWTWMERSCSSSVSANSPSLSLASVLLLTIGSEA